MKLSSRDFSYSASVCRANAHSAQAGGVAVTSASGWRRGRRDAEGKECGRFGNQVEMEDICSFEANEIQMKMTRDLLPPTFWKPTEQHSHPVLFKIYAGIQIYTYIYIYSICVLIPDTYIFIYSCALFREIV